MSISSATFIQVNNSVHGRASLTASSNPKSDRESTLSKIQGAINETLSKLEQAFSTLSSIKNEENAEVTLHLPGRTMEIFPLRITAKNHLFNFRIPLKDGGLNKAFHFYCDSSEGHLQDMYPKYGLKEDYGLRGDDLMRLTDLIAKAFKLSESSLWDQSRCTKIEGIKKFEGKDLEEELARFANLHNLSLEKKDKINYCNEIIQRYCDCLEIAPFCGFELKYSRALIKGNSWYGEHGYYPSSMTPDEYLAFINSLRAKDLRQCFPEKSTSSSSFVELMYREFVIHTGSDREHSLGIFFKWLSEEHPYVISEVITDIRNAQAGIELMNDFFKIEDFSVRMVKKYYWSQSTSNHNT